MPDERLPGEEEAPGQEAQAGHDAGEDEHDHQITHDILGLQTGHTQGGQGPEGLDHVGPLVAPGNGHSGTAGLHAQLGGGRHDNGALNGPLTAAGGHEEVDDTGGQEGEHGEGDCVGDAHKELRNDASQGDALLIGHHHHAHDTGIEGELQQDTGGAAGILLQFPFYAGIMGMMVVANEQGVSLAGVISQFFVSISNTITFPVFTFLSAGIVNFFVPSGGGQWAVQGPIVMPAAAQLGVEPGRAAMAIAWGDQWTNMIQPFWALPALGVAGLKAKDIMGYLVVVLIFTGIVACLGFLAWGFFFPG